MRRKLRGHARAGRVLETRSEPDEFRFAECRAEKRQPHGKAAIQAGRHSNVRITCNRSGRGASAGVRIAVHGIDQPRRARGQCDNRVEAMFT